MLHAMTITLSLNSSAKEYLVRNTIYEAPHYAFSPVSWLYLFLLAAEICSFCQSYLWLTYSSSVIQNRLVMMFCMFTVVFSFHLVSVTQY